MTIDRFRAALSGAGPPPDALELSEIIWLARHLGGPAGEPGRPAPDAPRDAAERGPAPIPAAPAAAGPATAPQAALHAPVPAGAAPDGLAPAAGILVPTAPMLGDPLGVQRALRPLKRRVPSRRRRELDEEATAERVADTRLWTPVLAAAPERWLTLNLVVDTGASMRLWRPLAGELAETLSRQGAFRDVRVSHLHASGRVSSAPDGRPRGPATLLDPSGRAATLVLSDCSGPHWWDGRAGRAVRRWGRAGPTAILQPLPERLWRRTAAPATPGLAVLPRPGGPNSELRFAPYDGVLPPGVPVPVLEIEPRWFAGWARLVSGAGPQPTAMAVPGVPGVPAVPGVPGVPGASGPRAAPVRREQELPIGERVRRFLVSASPGAAELAAHVAVSVPSLPVMRLIQRRVLAGSGPGQLAEVLLSGLLRPLPGVRYEFVPGARAALLDTLPRPEALHTRHVLEAVSAEIERRAGTSAETFRALLRATGGGPAPGERPFALLSAEARALLDRAAVPPPPPPPARAEPRRPVIGSDADGRPVTLDPLRGDGRHGLVVGDAEARHAAVRAVVLAMAEEYPPDALSIVLGGLGEHPLGGPAGLPHVTYSDEELLGGPDRLRAFLSVLTDELDRRARHAPSAPLLVVVDVSLTLPSSRPQVTDTLVRLAARGERLGVHLLVAATTWERSTGWERLLPLLAWRIAVGGPSPQVLQRVMGRARLPFADGPGAAYLRRPGQEPLAFSVAPRPSAPERPWEFVVGTLAETREPVVLDLRTTRHLVVQGAPGWGKTTLLRRVVAALRAGGVRRELFVVDPSGTLRDAAGADREFTFHDAYASTSSRVRSTVRELVGTLERRDPSAEPFLVVDDLELLDPEVLVPLVPYLDAGEGLHLILARTGDAPGPLSARLAELGAPVVSDGGGLAPGRAVVGRDGGRAPVLLPAYAPE